MTLKSIVADLKEGLDNARQMRHYVKTGSDTAVGKNIRYFQKKKGFPRKQAIAAALNVQRRFGG